MAYTKIHAIKATVDKAIDYICNPDKTDENIFISSFACSPETAAIDFKYTLDLAEIIKYAEQYRANRSYHIGYKKAKNPDAYFRRYESQIILYGGARRMLEQAGINLKSLNIDKLKSEYQELTRQKNELTSTYKSYEKEVRELSRKLDNLNQYLEQDTQNTQDAKNRQQTL